jgi:arylsulfatase A-like enzyme
MHKYLIGLLLLMSLSCARKPETPRHVILVTVDTLRADALSCYGSPYPATDVQHASSRGSAAGFTLDEIAAQGRRYADVFAPRGMTFPSIATLFTARSPIEHGALSNGDVLDGSFETMAERFKAAGFATAAFTTNKLLVPRSGIEQGFDHFETDFGPERDEKMRDAALAWLDRQSGDARAFVWLHLIGPHLPYEPGPEFAALYAAPGYRGPADGTRAFVDPFHRGALEASDADHAHMRALYNGEVARIDRTLSHFFRDLSRKGTLDSSLLVITADHGEELAERNRYYGHSKSVYASVLHVPLIVRSPMLFEGGAVQEGLSGLDDLGRWIPEWMGVARIPASGPDSIEVGLWQERIFSVRSENWRLVWNEEGVEPKEMPEGSYPVPRLALYDVHRDPSELQDVAARHPETVERMKLDLERWRALQRPFRGERKAPDAERMRAMRELGYAGEEPR